MHSRLSRSVPESHQHVAGTLSNQPTTKTTHPYMVWATKLTQHQTVTAHKMFWFWTRVFLYPSMPHKSQSWNQRCTSQSALLIHIHREARFTLKMFTLKKTIHMWPATMKWVVMCQMAIFMFSFSSESKSYTIYNGENHFLIRGLVAELHVFEYGGMTFGTFEKTCSKCWRLPC